MEAEGKIPNWSLSQQKNKINSNYTIYQNLCHLCEES